jgi:hypothetical protein
MIGKHKGKWKVMLFYLNYQAKRTRLCRRAQTGTRYNVVTGSGLLGISVVVAVSSPSCSKVPQKGHTGGISASTV